MKILFSMFLLAAALVLTGADWKMSDFQFRFKTDRADAIYNAGDEVCFSGNVLVKGKNPEKMTVRCQVIRDGYKVLKSEKIQLSEKPIVFTVKFDRPGWIRLLVEVLDEQGKVLRIGNRQVQGGVGAMADPEKIVPGAAEPADFDAFWAAKRAELDKVPVKALRVPFAPENGKYFNCWDIKVDCAGGMPVSGYLCIPKGAKPKSLPVAVRFHGAGVRSANAVLYYRGLIVLDVNAHGIENGKDAAFYSDLQKKDLNNYHARNKLDRNKGYFVGMFMRVMRALDYVKTLPEWDGKTLIVFGGSQGGAQSLAAAALDKDVTHCIAGVPALCDQGGVLAERSAGWPQFVSWFRIGKMTEEDRAVLPEVAYVDCAYMARRIKAKTYIGTGFMDYVCAPTSVFAAYNNIPAGTEKDIVTTPDKAHNAPNTKGMKWLADFSAQVFKSQGKE